MNQPKTIEGHGDSAPFVSFHATGSHLEIETPRGFTAHTGGSTRSPAGGAAG